MYPYYIKSGERWFPPETSKSIFNVILTSKENNDQPNNKSSDNYDQENLIATLCTATVELFLALAGLVNKTVVT